MKTKISRVFNRKIELWETTKVSDGFGGNKITNNYVGDLWASVRDVIIRNYDVSGSSINKTEKQIIVRKNGLSSNKNFFVINGLGYQINNIVANFKENQFQCFCEATNFEYQRNAVRALLIGSRALLINNRALITNG